MKQDERDFLVVLYKTGEKPREIINGDNFKINHKSAWYLLEKWCGKVIYEYGVTLDLGWLTAKGRELARELMYQEKNQ